MPKITGEIRDAATGEIVQARVQVLSPTGANVAPADAMWKVGPGEPFFYSDGQFSLETTRGYHRRSSAAPNTPRGSKRSK